MTTSAPEGNKSASEVTLNHHIRHEYCRIRPQYRKSKKLTAVKAYSVANESRHLLVFGVPQINLTRELRDEFRRYGTVQLVQNITENIRASGSFELEAFTDVFHVKYEKLDKARRAKKLLDAKNFYGGILHISYAPERESVEELRLKLDQRRKEVIFRLQKNRQPQSTKPGAKRDSSSVGGWNHNAPIKRMRKI